MTRFNDDNLYAKRISGILLAGTFLMHLAWTVYVSNEESLDFIVGIQGVISSIFYSMPGFEWEGIGAYAVTAALISSFAANVLRRFLEGFFLGWPRFKDHDRNSLIRASTLLMGYGVMAYFAIGFFGEKYSSRSLDVINIFLIAISTYIVGLLVDLVDEVISSFYCVYIIEKV